MFILDEHTGELVAKVFDGGLPDKQNTIRLKIGQGIAGDVAETGAVSVCLALNRLHECLCHTLLFSRMHCCHAPNEHVNRTVGNVCEVQNFAYGRIIL